jgi:hypothetical protein
MNWEAIRRKWAWSKPDTIPTFYLSISIPVAPTWSVGQPWNSSFQYSFLIYTQSVGLRRRGISPSQGRYLQRTTQTRNKRRQISIPWVGFEPTIPVFERVKRFHALDRAPNVISYSDIGLEEMRTTMRNLHCVPIDTGTKQNAVVQLYGHTSLLIILSPYFLMFIVLFWIILQATNVFSSLRA